MLHEMEEMQRLLGNASDRSDELCLALEGSKSHGQAALKRMWEAVDEAISAAICELEQVSDSLGEDVLRMRLMRALEENAVERALAKKEKAA